MTKTFPDKLLFALSLKMTLFTFSEVLHAITRYLTVKRIGQIYHNYNKSCICSNIYKKGKK